MNRTPLYVTAQRWSPEVLEALKGRATGVILGDLFCQKRMFENEWFDLFELAQMARQLGFNVIFQTPAYNTTRTAEATLSLARKLAASSLIDAAFAQDIGMVEAMAGTIGAELWWDRFSFNRDFVPNAYLIDFLLAHGVTRIEVLHPAHVRDVTARGASALVYGYGPEIAAFGRICYTEYFLEEPCERKILCSRSQPLIASVDKVALQYVADGYTLLDREQPQRRMQGLDAETAGEVSGITAYIRTAEEIEALDEFADAVMRTEGAAASE